ncbi:MAG: hypothetical protein PHT07_20950 [Paludibacter sp.]|nr:hypothetical protein [Paludibacter sp.]
MPEFKKITTKEQIQEALSRNKRFGIKNKTSFEQKQQVEYRSFLEWYVFDRMGISPQLLIGNIQTQYYAEQNLRDRRQRNIDFIRGRQFNEPVWDADLQQWTTQFNYLRKRGIPPLTYNVISKFVRSLVGQFREMNTGNIVRCESRDERGGELANLLSICLDKIKDANKSKSKDAMNFKEMLASGRPIYKVGWGTKNGIGKPDVRFRIVTSPKFMVNPGVVDYDLDNMHQNTEIHDVTLDDIILAFSNGDYDRGKEIRRLYIQHEGSQAQKSSYSYQSFDGSQLRNMSFTFSSNSSYRYIEHWTKVSDFEAITYDPLDGTGIPTAHKWENIDKIKKAVDQENLSRLEKSEGQIPENELFIQFRTDYVTRGYVIYMTPWGYILDVKESPYSNSTFPYVMTPPDINGEVWGMVEELINPQLSMDRQILNADSVISNASKGVWLIPDTAVPDEMSNKEYISELKKTDGAVIYKVREDQTEKHVPQQIYANSANVSQNIQQLIHLYSNLVDEVSGNYGAAQGRDGQSKTASGYAMETQNAGINVRDTMETFLTMLVDRDELILDFILQGYTKEDFERITGVAIDPIELTHYNFCIEQSKGTNSPAYRMQLEQELLQLVYNQLLPFEVFMEVSSNPVMIQAKQKLDEFNKRQAAIGGQQIIPGQPQITNGQVIAGQPVEQPVTTQGYVQR